MESKNTGLASPPLTPPYGTEPSYRKPRNSEKPKAKKDNLNKYNNRCSYISTSTMSSIGTRSLNTNRRSVTIPDLSTFKIPEPLMPLGPNGERIPIMIPDGNGGLIPLTTSPKKSKKKSKSKSSSYINQLSPPLSNNIYKIDENKSSNNTSSASPNSHKSKTSLKKAGKRQSLLIPLTTTALTPSPPSSNNTSAHSSHSGENIALNNKNVPLFIIPTGPNGKIDRSALPQPMSSSELMERQREYEESIIMDDNQSYIFRKRNSEKRKDRKNSISSMRSSYTTPPNFLKSKSEGIITQKRRGSKGQKNNLALTRNDNFSIYSVESNILDGRNPLSESARNLQKPESLYNDTASELSSTNFSLRNIESNNSSTSFYDEPDSPISNPNDDAFEDLSPEKKDSAIILKNKIDESLEAAKTFKDADLKFNNFNYIANNIQLLPIALHEIYRSNLIKVMKKSIQASQHGDTLYLLGNLYTSGFPGITTVELKSFRPKYGKAYDCFFQGYKINHQECCFNVAVCHELGLGTKVDKRKAYQIYQKTATLNHPGAMCRLGLACLNGELGMKVNLKEGVRWLRLSTMYASKEYPHAYYHLATIYERGIPNLIIRDYKYAVQLLEKASLLGHIKSQHRLGLCYEHGKLGVEVDAKISMKYFGMAAAKGHGESMFELAGWYLTGSEVYKEGGNDNDDEIEYIIEPSNEIAFQWTRKAAERNLPKAEFALGYFYDNGIGINKDTEEAMRWYYVASTHKDPKAIEKMKEKSSVFWLNQFKASELVNIEDQVYSGFCNYDLIEDELNLHFTTESVYESILNCDTIKSESNSTTTTSNNSANNSSKSLSNENDSSSNRASPSNSKSNSRSNTPVSTKSDKCIIM